MAKNDTTTRFNADISELKAAFQEASRQIKLANSEFKAASSGMEDWNKSADGVTAKLSQLDKVLDAQKKQLKSLNDQYELTVKEYGENSAAAENLKIKINNQQAAINSTQQQINSYNQQLQNMQSQAQKSESAAEKLRDEIKNQEQDLSKLKSEYASVVLEQGRESNEAKALANQIDSLSNSLNDNRNKLKDAENAANEFDNSLNNSAKATEESKSAFEKLHDEIKNQEQDLSKLKSEYASVVLEQGRESNEAKALAGQIKNLSDDLDVNRVRLQNAETAADEFDNALSDVNDTSGKSGDFFSSMKDSLANLVSQGLQLAIDKLKEFATDVVNTGVAFDSEMSKVGAISGANAKDMQLLRDKAKEMGSETKFSAAESAEALEYMAMAGWKTNDMLGGIEGIMHLAAASGEELGTTSDIVTDALTALGMAADESGHFADVLAAASSNANTNVSLMGESFQYVAPVAGAMGASAEDLAIALGLMANSGIKGSQAGNSLKNALVNLTKPTKAQAAAMQELGFISTETIQKIDFEKVEKAEQKVQSATLDLDNAQIRLNDAIEKYGENSSQAQIASNNYEKAQQKLTQAQAELEKEQAGVSKEIAGANTLITDSEGNMRSLGEIMGMLREKMGKVNVELTDADGNARDFDDIVAELSTTTEGLAQAEQMQAAAAIFGKQNMAGMLAIINASEQDYNKLTDAIYDCDGTAKDMADTMSDNLGGDMTKFKSQLESIKIDIYEKFEPALRDIVQYVTSEMLPKIQGFISSVSQFISDHKEEINKFKETIKSYISAVIDFLATEVIPRIKDFVNWCVEHLPLIEAGIAGIAAAFVAFKAVTFIQSAITAFQTLATVIQAVGVKQAILNAIMAANPVGLVVAAIAGLVAAFAILWNKSEAFRNFWKGLWENIKIAVSDFADFFVSLWENLKIALIAVIEFFISLWNGFKDSFISGWQMIGDFFVNLWNKIKSFFSVTVTFFKSLWIGFKVTIENALTAISDFFIGSWESLKAVWNLVGEFFKSVWNSFTDFIVSGWQTVADFFVSAWESLKTGVSETWDSIKSILETVSDWFNETIIIPVSTFFSNMWDNLVAGATLAWEGIKTVFSVITEWFGNKFTEAWTAVKNVFSVGGQIFDGIKEGITSAFKTVVNAIIRGINKVVSIPFNAINRVLDRLRNLSIMDIQPFGWLSDISVPKIPELREGGVLKKGKIGFLEGDGDEAVVPLEKNTRWIDEVADRISRNMGVTNQYNSSIEDKSVTNNFYQTNNSPKALSRLEIYRQSKNLLKTLS